MNFKLASDYEPRGDQPEAIEQLVRGIDGRRKASGPARRHRLGQDLHDGQGDRAAQPALRSFWRTTRRSPRSSTTNSNRSSRRTPSNISSATTITTSPKPTFLRRDTYIEKESTINDELDKLRMSATRSLFERRDVIIVASVSCIYGIGSPEAYYGMMLMLEKGQQIAREAMLRKLVEIQYERAEDLRRGTFRVRGDMHRNLSAVRRPSPSASSCGAVRSKPSARSIRSPAKSVPADGEISRLPIYPKSHYVMPAEQRERAIQTILEELDWWKPELEKQGKYRRSAARVAAHACSTSK